MKTRKRPGWASWKLAIACLSASPYPPVRSTSVRMIETTASGRVNISLCAIIRRSIVFGLDIALIPSIAYVVNI